MQRQKQQQTTNGNTRVRVFMLDVEGPGAKETVESLVTALHRQNGQALPQTPRPPAALPTNGSNAEEGEPPQQMSLDELPSPAPMATEAETPRSPRVRTPPRPAKFLDDIKAHEEQGGFKSFVNGRNVDSDNKRGLVAAMWLKEKGIDQFGTDHIHTCFSVMKGWQMPDDPGSLLRNMAKRKVELVRHVAGKPGLYEITGKAINAYADIT